MATAATRLPIDKFTEVRLEIYRKLQAKHRLAAQLTANGSGAGGILHIQQQAERRLSR